MSKFFNSSAALALAVFCVNVGVGQQTGTRPAQNRVEEARSTNSTQLDRPMVEFFASKLVLCNNAQIQTSQMVADKAEHSDVKKFAEMLGKDHAKLNEQLKPFVASYGEMPAMAANDQPSTGKPAVTGNSTPQPGQVFSNASTQSQTGVNTGDSVVLRRLFEICQDVHVNQMDACKDMLSQKSGSEFDKAYIGSQIVGHMALAAELKTLESRSPAEFQNVIRAALKSVEGHMQKAESICKELDKDEVKTETSNR